MKVRVSFTVDIDKGAWMDLYDCEARDVRADVNDYAKQFMYRHFENEGVTE